MLKLSLARGMKPVVTSLFQAALQKAYPQMQGQVVGITRSQSGDLQCNSAMSMFKLLKQSGASVKEPRDVAAALVEHLPANNLLGQATVAGKGFINITIASEQIATTLLAIARQGPFSPDLLQKKQILVDFSSPNIAKEMHVGHLRSTIIGDTLSRLFEFCGADVTRVNHVGDWGTQFGMLIQYLKETYPDWQKAPPNVSELNQFYKNAKARFDDCPTFKEQARLNVPLLQGGDPHCRAIWATLCSISRKEFQKVYDRLDVTLEEVGESFYNPLIPQVLEELIASGQVVENDGAKCIKRENWDIPLFMQKSDGGFGYDSTDMAALSHRLRTLKKEWLVYVTDEGQARHFQMCFETARVAGWVQPGQTLSHVGFGVICGSDGKRFKSRSGDTVRLVDLLDASVTRMEASLRERKQAEKTDLSDKDIRAAAVQIGYAAIKYFDLKNNPATNYVFSYDRMLDTKGDTAVYLLFAFARLCSIINKAETETGVALDINQMLTSDVVLDHPCERALAVELIQLPDVLSSAVSTLQPNSICEYLYRLSVKFTDFVTKCYVLGSPPRERNSRLLLCEATRRSMLRIFFLLGINPLQRI